MKKHMLMNVFDNARTSNAPYVFVLIEAMGTEEAIVIPSQSFDDKQHFYKNAYNDDLVHVMNEDVFIKKADYGEDSKLKLII